jgi:hypothetical protein
MQLTNHVELEFQLYPSHSNKNAGVQQRKTNFSGLLKVAEQNTEQTAEKREAEEEEAG